MALRRCTTVWRLPIGFAQTAMWAPGSIFTWNSCGTSCSTPRPLSFGHNACLVLRRVADLAVQVGRIGDAIALYNSFSATRAPYHARALAAYKRLHVAVEAGRVIDAREAYAHIVASVWEAGPPLSHGDLEAWESSFQLPVAERETVLAQMYLALGKVCNSQRRLSESSRWLERGLRHALAGGRKQASRPCRFCSHWRTTM